MTPAKAAADPDAAAGNPALAGSNVVAGVGSSPAFGGRGFPFRGPLLTWSATRPTVARIRAGILAADGEERAPTSPKAKPTPPYAGSPPPIVRSHCPRQHQVVQLASPTRQAGEEEEPGEVNGWKGKGREPGEGEMVRKGREPARGGKWLGSGGEGEGARARGWIFVFGGRRSALLAVCGEDASANTSDGGPRSGPRQERSPKNEDRPPKQGDSATSTYWNRSSARRGRRAERSSQCAQTFGVGEDDFAAFGLDEPFAFELREGEGDGFAG